jgi:hypothetical protein
MARDVRALLLAGLLVALAGLRASGASGLARSRGTGTSAATCSCSPVLRGSRRHRASTANTTDVRPSRPSQPRRLDLRDDRGFTLCASAQVAGFSPLRDR